MDLKLKGKKVFITGSTQGIGFAIAQQLLQEDAEVTINGRNAEKTAMAKQQLEREFPNSKVNSVVVDFSSKEQVTRMLKELNDYDILINNIGIFEIKDFQDIDDNDWYRYFEVNVMSSVRLSQRLMPAMLKNNWGRVIFISSESAVNVPENMIHYGMTKAAMMAVSNGLSKLTKGTEVTVNTVLGGPTYSDGVASVVHHISAAQQIPAEQMKAAIIQQSNPHILLQRFINPNEIANMVTYLSSPLAVATNGSSLRVDSGVLRVF